MFNDIFHQHIKGGNGVGLKVKVKVSLIYPLFSNMEGGWQRHRSCGVVRSIMSPSRGDDPGSNPGTSTKYFQSVRGTSKNLGQQGAT